MCNEGKKNDEIMERTNWQTVQKKSTTRNTAWLDQISDIGETRCSTTNIGTGTVDYCLWIMDQKLRATFGQQIVAWFFSFGIIAKLTHIFLYVNLNFLPVLRIVNSLKITKTFMYSVLTKGIKNKTECKASAMAKWQIDLTGQNFDKPKSSSGPGL